MLKFRRVDGSQVPENCSFAPEGLLSNGCPSSEWEKIQQNLELAAHSLPQKYVQTYKLAIGTFEMELYGKTSQRQLYIGMNDAYDFHIDPHWATTSHVAVADALITTGALWYVGLNNITATPGRGSPLAIQSDAIHRLSGESYQPFSQGVCAADIIQDDTDTRPLAFPILYSVNDPSETNANISLPDNFSVPAILYPGISRTEILSTAGSLSQYRLRWVELPEKFNGSSIGAVILLPQSSSTSSFLPSLPQNILLCNLAAGWGTTTLQMHTAAGATSSVASDTTQDDAVPFSSDVDKQLPTQSENTDYMFSWGQGYPQRPINVTQDWAQYLNPTVKTANRSVFDIIMQQHIVLQGPESYFAIALSATNTLAAMIANGLARIGFESTLQGSPKSILSRDGTSWIDGNYWLSGKDNVFQVNPNESKDWVKLHVNSTVQGYAYNTESTSSRFAIAILTMYCIIAIAHLLYSGISGSLHCLAASHS